MLDIQAKFKELSIQIASSFYHVDSHRVSPMLILALLTCTLNLTISTQGLVGLSNFYMFRLHFLLHLLRRIRGLPLPILPKRGRALYVDFFYLERLLTEGEVHSQEERRLTSYTNSFLFVMTYFIRVLFYLVFITPVAGMYLWLCLGLFNSCGVLDLKLYIMLNYFHYIVL